MSIMKYVRTGMTGEQTGTGRPVCVQRTHFKDQKQLSTYSMWSYDKGLLNEKLYFISKFDNWKSDKSCHMGRQKQYLQDPGDMNESPTVALAFCFSPFS